ncbi:MAG: universal stress protein [Pseudomonadales bacterium]
MSDYTHILLAVDLSEEAQQVADKAKALAAAYSAQLSIIHVIEPISFTYGGDIPLDFSSIQEEIQSQAKLQLSKLSEPMGIASEGQHLVLGRPENEIHNTAEEIGANLIVVGSHGRHGLALIFGSTANGVLHGASCDVLAVRVSE